MSGRVVSDIQTRTEGESLYIRYNTDANVVNGLKNDSSYEFIGEVILKINVVSAEKTKVKVYVNQHESVSHIQIRHAYDFSLCFLHELLMSFLILHILARLSYESATSTRLGPNYSVRISSARSKLSLAFSRSPLL